MIVHAWDLARATGQPTEFDPQLGRQVLAWGRDNIPPQLRGTEADGGPFAPPVPIHPSTIIAGDTGGGGSEPGAGQEAGREAA